MSREYYKEILGAKFEKQVYNECFKFAMNNDLSLDWLSQCGIKQYYIAQCERVKENLKLFPLLMGVDNIIMSDLAMNKSLEVFNSRATYIQKKYSKDHTCGRCKEKKILISKMQTRAADEGHTVIFTCDNCGFTRREN